MKKRLKYIKTFAEFATDKAKAIPVASTKGNNDSNYQIVKICIDRPRPLVSAHARMWNAIAHNPENKPQNIDQKKNIILASFMNNPHGSFPMNEASMLTEMAITTGSKWQPNATLNISFMDGTDIQKQQTIQMAKEWLTYAKIKFNFLTDDSIGEIRISFNSDPGSWSYIGTDCLSIPKNQPTMNFGWLTDETVDEEWRRVVVHEFGHALGCIHEHQNPAGGIQWNKPAVYKYYEGPPNNWSQAEVDSNIFQTYDADKTQFTSVDPNSIMMYPIPATFTLNGFSVGMNTDLSGTDKAFIKQQYPPIN